MKNLTYLVGTLVAGIVFCFVMSVVTAVKEHRGAVEVAPHPIVTPATSQ
jgi:hypothetical protein